MVAGSGIFCNEIIAANEVHTRNGLFVVDSSLKVVNRYVSNKSNSLSNSSICSFAKDWSGNLWIGTYSGGINLIHPRDYNFGYIDNLMNNGGVSNKTKLQSLSGKGYRVPAGSSRGFLLLHSTGGLPIKSEVDVPLIYADFYFLEALKRYKNWYL